MPRLGYNKKLTARAQELRSEMTKPERKLWYDFLKLQPERWLRQRPIGHFIVDFYCASSKLVVELDGSQHYTEEGLIQDAERTAILEEHGIKVIRFTNQEVLNNFTDVCQQITLETKANHQLKLQKTSQ
jgi:very-short-patch-repair endonuclease